MKLLLTAFCLLLALGPAGAQPAAPSPACHGCAFSDDIDQKIRLCQRLAANGDSCEPYNLRRLVPTQPGVPPLADDAMASFTTSKAVRWSAWSSRLEWLSWYLPVPDATKPLAGTAGQYERLPEASGRQLFLAGDGPNEPGLLLEFQGPRFRLIMLNYEAQGSSTCHRYLHPDADLLVFTNTDGLISKIFNAATTWLSIFDLRTNTWLLDTVVEADNDDSDYSHTQRRYQVKDAGRTVTLGPYRYTENHDQAAPFPEKDEPRSNHDLPPGTYHLRAGRYQRATATAPPAASPGAAPPGHLGGRGKWHLPRCAGARVCPAGAGRRQAAGRLSRCGHQNGGRIPCPPLHARRPHCGRQRRASVPTLRGQPGRLRPAAALRAPGHLASARSRGRLPYRDRGHLPQSQRR